MRLFIPLFFLLLFPLFARAESHPLLKHFHVCTVAAHPHGNLDKLRASCERHGINLEILGLNKPFLGNGSKFVYMQEYIETLKDYEIVMYVEDFDALVIANKEVILEKFLKLKTLFVISAEKTCYPCPAYHNIFPVSSSPFKYINTEGYIGYAGYLKNWFRKLSPIDPYGCDQEQAVSLYARDAQNRHLYVLDHQCEIFLPLYGVKKNELAIDYKNKTLTCVPTRSTPCVVHTSDWTFFLWNKIYDRLIKPHP